MRKQHLFIICYSIIIAQIPDELIAPKKPVSNIYHGVEIIDNYRYMEDMTDPEVLDWVRGQADYAADILDNLPLTEILLERLVELDSGRPFRLYSIHRMKDGGMLYRKIRSGENQAKLYYRTSMQGEEELILDPEALSEGRDQHYSLQFYVPSVNGNYLIYGLAEGGSEETVIHVKDLTTGKDTDDIIDRIETAYNRPQWKDEEGFFYCRRQELPNDVPQTEIYKNTKTYYHELGTDPEMDKPIFGIGLSKSVSLTDTDFPSISLSPVNDFIVGKVKHGDNREISLYATHINRIFDDNIPWQQICSESDSVETYSRRGKDIYLVTSNNAPRYKIVKTRMDKPDFPQAKTVFEPSELVYRYISQSRNKMYISAMDGGYNRLIEFDPNSGEKSFLDIPANESAYIFSASPWFDEVYIGRSSWTYAGKKQSWSSEKKQFKDLMLEPPGIYDNPGWLNSSRVLVKSHDGVKVPLSIVHGKDIELNGQNPTLISGYGAYGSSRGVWYSSTRLAWLEQGGIYAIAHVRGGGEFGKQWHLDGMMETKPNTWKDFIACSQFLIDEGYTSPEFLAGQGGSAGGILIGRAITERPDLYRCAVINVGCMDMLRMEITTNGVPNIKEFGSVVTETGFKALLEMSSLHQVEDGIEYPAILSTHGINDPRVEPWFSAKMTARLQDATTSDLPILFRVDYDAGHGIGSTKEQRFKQTADTWAFLLWQMGK